MRPSVFVRGSRSTQHTWRILHSCRSARAALDGDLIVPARAKCPCRLMEVPDEGRQVPRCWQFTGRAEAYRCPGEGEGTGSWVGAPGPVAALAVPLIAQLAAVCPPPLPQRTHAAQEWSTTTRKALQSRTQPRRRERRVDMTTAVAYYLALPYPAEPPTRRLVPSLAHERCRTAAPPDCHGCPQPRDRLAHTIAILRPGLMSTTTVTCRPSRARACHTPTHYRAGCKAGCRAGCRAIKQSTKLAHMHAGHCRRVGYAT